MTDPTDRPLPTTSYAVLGLLSLRSWTGYELTQQFQRSIAFCLPKTESVLYEEPRRLVRRGLAVATKETSGGRSRTRYEITDDGRAALHDWLGTATEPPKLEIEPLIRLLFADQGDLGDLEATVASMRRWAVEQRAAGLPVVADISDGSSPFAARSHLQSLFALYLSDLYDLTERWCDRADAELATWTSAVDQGLTPGAAAIAREILGPDPTT